MKPGDTLYAIARKFGLKAGTLGDANNIVDTGSLNVGQVLTIPGDPAIGSPRVASKPGRATALNRVPPVKMVKTRRVPLPAARITAASGR